MVDVFFKWQVLITENDQESTDDADRLTKFQLSQDAVDDRSQQAATQGRDEPEGEDWNAL